MIIFVHLSVTQSMRAEMTVSKNTVIHADMRFSKLLRIEGSVEGKIVAPADVSIYICLYLLF